jgi:hypothetical protein
MKKLILILFLFVISQGADKLSYNSSYCSLESKTTYVIKKDAFGNTKKVKITKLKELAYRLLKNPSNETNKIIIMQLWAEIFALNKKYYEKFFQSPVDRAVDFDVYKTILQIDIQKGLLPTQFNLNVSNLQTSKMKIGATVSIYSLAGALLSYDNVFKNFDLSRDRILALQAYLTYKNKPVIPLTCSSKEWEVSSINEYILRELIKLVLKKDIDTIKLISLLVSSKFDKVDGFLLNNKEVNNLFNYAKKHYIDFLNKNKRNIKNKGNKNKEKKCKNKKYTYLIRYICLSNKKLATNILNELKKIKGDKFLKRFHEYEIQYNNHYPYSNATSGAKYAADIRYDDFLWEIADYFNKNYCKLKDHSLIPILLIDDGNILKDKAYCVVYYINKKTPDKRRW